MQVDSVVGDAVDGREDVVAVGVDQQRRGGGGGTLDTAGGGEDGHADGTFARLSLGDAHVQDEAAVRRELVSRKKGAVGSELKAC